MRTKRFDKIEVCASGEQINLEISSLAHPDPFTIELDGDELLIFITEICNGLSDARKAELERVTKTALLNEQKKVRKK